MVVWEFWFADVISQDYDMIILENGEHFVKKLFTEGLPAKYGVKWAVFGATDMGIPTRRTRFYGMAYNRDTLAWMGGMSED
eukprot:9170757-Karenia_brevis.AAC.1